MQFQIKTFTQARDIISTNNILQKCLAFNWIELYIEIDCRHIANVFPLASGSIKAQKKEWVTMPEFKSCLLDERVERI